MLLTEGIIKSIPESLLEICIAGLRNDAYIIHGIIVILRLLVAGALTTPSEN